MTARVKAGTSKAAAAQRRKLFIDAYIANGENGSAAAIAAGFARKTARSQAARLLADVNIRAEVERRRTELADRFKINTESVLRSLAQAVHFDPRKLYRADGSLKDVRELDDDTAMALSGIEVTEEFGPAGSTEDLEGQPHGGALRRSRGKVVVGYTKKLKWLDKNTAREQAMKHLGLYEKDNQQSKPVVIINAEDAGVL